ncbi:MAG TPA: RHS repeat-associated core domain-containing protein [bacterium]|nr:RHS repeat-associated core domain-containing protein [bacterium]
MERTHPADDFFFDHLGTPVAVSDLSGQVVWTHRFSPFGKTIELNEDVDGDGVKLTLNLRFPGQYYDAESGLHYNWHRYYDPETGRYVMLYTLPNNIAHNLRRYIYVFNNPLKDSDISGLMELVTEEIVGAVLSPEEKAAQDWTNSIPCNPYWCINIQTPHLHEDPLAACTAYLDGVDFEGNGSILPSSRVKACSKAIDDREAACAEECKCKK